MRIMLPLSIINLRLFQSPEYLHAFTRLLVMATSEAAIEVSERALASELGWTRRKVITFLTKLQQESLVIQETIHKRSVLRIVKPERFYEVTPNSDPKVNQKRSTERSSAKPDNSLRSNPPLSPNGDIPPKGICSKEPELTRIGSHFKATAAAIEKLIAEDGREEFKNRVESMNDYCASMGKRYKDYAAAYRNWRKRDKKTALQPKHKRPMTNAEKAYLATRQA